MKTNFLTILLICLISFSSLSQNSDIQKLRENLLHDALVNQGYKPRIERYITSDYSKAGEYLAKLNAEGRWNDVDYSDRDNNWHPLHHLDRVLVMSFNYMKDTSKLYQSPELIAGIEKSIEYWYKVNPECDNWYKNRIAKQFYFNVIALLLNEKINQSLHAKMVNDLTENPTMTGSNRTLLATSTFYKGVLENDPKKINLGVTGVTDQILVTTDEGIQPDYSFHQHGKFIYNGSYGFNFLRESIWLATIVHGTSFAYSNEFIKILRHYYLEGTRWMIRGGLIDYNVRGRQVGRSDAMKLYANLLIPILNHMIIADPAYAIDYQKSINLIKEQKPQNTFGHKHFWRSDYTIHHRGKYSTSLKMCSERTVGIELNMNSENKLGYWLPYGLTYIYQRGNEYDAIFPAWDWAMLPGVTNPYIEIEEKGKGVAYTQETEFVGGVSNGKYGLSVMDFSKNKTKAKKTWFWFDDEWVALGAAIGSEHEAPVITTVNQCLLNGKVWIDGKEFSEGFKNLNGTHRILHDNVGYVFPGKGKIQIKSEEQNGNMQQIYGLGKDTVYSAYVFSLCFDHGKNPKDETYQYIVVPGVEKKEFDNYSKNLPVEIISNTKEIQAVKHNKLQLAGIVFYKAGKVQLNKNISIEVDKPSCILFDEKNNTLSVCDPTAKLKELTIKIGRIKQEIIQKQVNLPVDGFAGKSIVVTLD